MLNHHQVQYWLFTNDDPKLIFVGQILLFQMTESFALSTIWYAMEYAFEVPLLAASPGCWAYMLFSPIQNITLPGVNF